MKKKAIGFITVLVLVLGTFATGVYAAKTDWLSFTGDSQVQESSGHVDEIMSILRQVNADKISAEEALAEIGEVDLDGLERRIKDLERELADKVREVADKQREIADKQREVDEKNGIINDKNKVIEGKDRVINELNEYISHLESELRRANEAVDDYINKTGDAVIEAREYVE